MNSTEIVWTRSKSGIYSSDCGRFSAYSVTHRGEWVLNDKQPGGRRRYFTTLANAKKTAQSLREGKL